MFNSIFNAIATFVMASMIGKQLSHKKVYQMNISSTIVATIIFIVNFLICSVLGNHNNALDYYSYLQLSLVVSQLVYYNLI